MKIDPSAAKISGGATLWQSSANALPVALSVFLPREA